MPYVGVELSGQVSQSEEAKHLGEEHSRRGKSTQGGGRASVKSPQASVRLMLRKQRSPHDWQRMTVGITTESEVRKVARS
jgi:hypothetical protein